MLSVEKEIGERLRQARESIGLSLDQLQERTNIQKSFIVAIEAGEFNKLPSPFYVRTYLRAYCKCVKIEPHHILRQYRKAEQAERGLTSVHQAITPEMLAQAQQQGLLNTTNLNLLGQNINLGQQQTVSNMMNRPSPKRVPRTNQNTALTIARTKPSNQQLQHQVGAGNHRKDLVTSHSPMEQTQQLRLDYKSNQNAPSQQTRRSQTADPIPSAYREQKQKNLTERIPTEEIQKKKTQTRSTNTNLQHSTTYRKLNRAQNKPKNSEPTSPSLLEKKQPQSELSRQKVTKMPRLSRSSVRSTRRSSKRGSFQWPNKKTLIIIVASLAICIPLVWATVAVLATDDQPDKQVVQDKPDNDVQTPQVQEKNEPLTETSTDEEQVVLTNSSPQQNTYEVSGTDTLNLRFQAQGESWIQVRKQPDPQKEGFLDEATLQSGHEDQYSHNFSDGKEIWISLGMPEAVIVTVNGKQIKSSKTIHIKQK